MVLHQLDAQQGRVELLEFARENSSQLQYTSHQRLQFETNEQQAVYEETYRKPVLLEEEHYAFCNQFDLGFLALKFNESKSGVCYCRIYPCLDPGCSLVQEVGCSNVQCKAFELEAMDHQGLLMNPICHGWEQTRWMLGMKMRGCPGEQSMSAPLFHVVQYEFGF